MIILDGIESYLPLVTTEVASGAIILDGIESLSLWLYYFDLLLLIILDGIERVYMMASMGWGAMGDNP